MLAYNYFCPVLGLQVTISILAIFLKAYMGVILPDGKITLRLFSVSRINDFSEIAHTFILLFSSISWEEAKGGDWSFFSGYLTSSL